jgi:hypothetical protein
MTNDTYIKKEFGGIVGRRIVAVRPLRDSELEDLYWHYSAGAVAFAIILEDGQVLIPAQDEEGNGPGHVILADLAGATA